MDAMGSKARNGYSAFCRQNFVGIDYGLVDCGTYDPLPDYYSGLLWSRVMGTDVLDVTSNDTSLRVYSHKHPEAGISLIALNLANRNVTLEVDLGKGVKASGSRATYYFQPGDGVGGRSVVLNGKPLLFKDGTLPEMTPITEEITSPLIVPPESIVFSTFKP